MLTEQWRDIPGFPGYQASSEGRIRSIDRVVMKRLRTDGPPLPYKRKGLVLKLEMSKGYLRVDLQKARLHSHVLVLLAFHGPQPSNEHFCRHLNGIRTDNRPENLKWGTRLENEADKVLHGTRAKGERHGKSVLTEAQAIKVHEELASGRKSRDIAKSLGISRAAVQGIEKGSTWRHVTPIRQSA